MGAQHVFASEAVSPSQVQRSAEKKMTIEARADRAARSTVTRLQLEILEDYQMPT